MDVDPVRNILERDDPEAFREFLETHVVPLGRVLVQAAELDSVRILEDNMHEVTDSEAICWEVFRASCGHRSMRVLEALERLQTSSMAWRPTVSPMI